MISFLKHRVHIFFNYPFCLVCVRAVTFVPESILIQLHVFLTFYTPHMCNNVQKLYARLASCRHPIYPYHLTAAYAVRYLTLKANRIDFQTHVNVPWYLFTRTHSAVVVVYFTTSSSPSHIPQPNWYEIVSVFLCAYRIEETIRKQANARGVRVRFCFLEFANRIQALCICIC